MSTNTAVVNPGTSNVPLLRFVNGRFHHPIRRILLNGMERKLVPARAASVKRTVSPLPLNRTTIIS
jgi:hypothetical protein